MQLKVFSVHALFYLNLNINNLYFCIRNLFVDNNANIDVMMKKI